MQHTDDAIPSSTNMTSLRTSNLASHLWMVYLAFGLLGISCYLWLGSTAQGLLYFAFGCAAALAVVVGVHLHRPRRRWAWYLFAAGLLSSAIGDGVYTYYETVLDDIAPWPSLADVFYLSYYGIAAFALLLLLRNRSRSQDLSSLIDAGIVTASATLLSWSFLISPYIYDPTLPLSHLLVAIGYPIGDLLVLAMIVRLAFITSTRVPTFFLLTVGFGVYLVTDAIYSIQVLENTYRSGGLLDFGWLAGYCLLGASALHPSMRGFPDRLAQLNPGLSWRRLALLTGIPVVSLSVLQVQGLLAGHAYSGVMLPGALGLFLLAVCRVALLAREVTQANADTSASQERYELMSRATNDAIWDWDILTGRVVWSGAIHTHFGHPDNQRQSSFDWWEELIHPEDAGRVSKTLTQALGGDGASFTSDYRLRCGDGSCVHVSDRGFIVRDQGGDPIRMVGSVTDISARKALEQQLEYQAFHDALTGLANRSVFRDHLEHALNQTERCGDRVAVLFIDLDRFKHVNDSLGHAAGDQLLVEVARRLEDCVRPGDTLSRHGGDEFTILLEDVDEAQAMVVAQRIRDVLKSPIHLSGQDVFVTVSVGIAIGDPGGSLAEGLIREADVAMYLAKVGGRAKHALFDSRSDPFTIDTLKLEVDLRRAVEREEFTVYYQPMVDLATGRAQSLEALVRWVHPERGILSPAEFLPVAEETGLIVAIGRQVRSRVCQQIAHWIDAYPRAEILPVFINCSPTEFKQPNLVADIEADLRAHGLDGPRIGIEITEHVVISDLMATRATIESLQRLGVQLALDDFGTGNAGLAHLLQLQVDILKIDKRFTDGLDAPISTALLTRAIIDLGRSLGMRVLTEGIETGEQAEALERLGSEFGQGYFFARPMSAEAVEQYLLNPQSEAATRHIAAS